MKKKKIIAWMILLLLVAGALFTWQAYRSVKKTGISGTAQFDKVKWTTKDGQDYPYRDEMLKDLMTNYTRHGIKRDSLLNLLGTATRTDTNFLFYRIKQDRMGFIPLHTKSLVLKFDSANALVWAKIHE